LRSGANCNASSCKWDSAAYAGCSSASQCVNKGWVRGPHGGCTVGCKRQSDRATTSGPQATRVAFADGPEADAPPQVLVLLAGEYSATVGTAPFPSRCVSLIVCTQVSRCRPLRVHRPQPAIASDPSHRVHPNVLCAPFLQTCPAPPHSPRRSSCDASWRAHLVRCCSVAALVDSMHPS
jgi:hypothetical protein